MKFDDTAVVRRAPERVPPKVAAQFAGGCDVSTFGSEGTGYQTKNIFSCRHCTERGRPASLPKEFQFVEVSYTCEGFQVWRTRCESEVVTIDFGGDALTKCDQNRATLVQSDGAPLGSGARAGHGGGRG